jgi:hypothetical protein
LHRLLGCQMLLVEFFLWGHLKEQHICTIPPRTIEDLVPGLQSAVTNDRCKHVKTRLIECHAVHCHLPWHGQRLLWTPVVTKRCPWFDNVIPCGIWWWRILKTKRHRTYVVYFSLGILNKESHLVMLVGKFCFILCVCVCVRARARTCIWEYLGNNNTNVSPCKLQYW